MQHKDTYQYMFLPIVDNMCMKVGRHFSGIPPPSFTHGERGGLRGVGMTSASSRGGGTGGLGLLSAVGGGGGGSGSIVGGQNSGGGGGGGVGGGMEYANTTDRELFSTRSVSGCCCCL